jgi:hypothetical protein
MTQDEIMEMAKQAHFDSTTWVDIFADNPTVGDVRNYLVAFAKLVAAKEREACATIYAQLFTDPENQPTQYGTVTVEFMNREISKERKACAKVCDEVYESWINIYGRYEFMAEGARACAAAIRARGEQA